MKWGDRALAIVLFSISCLWTYQSLKLPFPEFSKVSKMGPGHFPAGLGILMGLLSLVLLVKTFLPRYATSKTDEPPQPKEDGAAEGGVGKKNLIVGFCLFAAYVLVAPLTGFLPASVIFVFLMVRVIGRFRWVLSGLISIVITVFLWIVFVHWLSVPLPAGPWGA